MGLGQHKVLVAAQRLELFPHLVKNVGGLKNDGHLTTAGAPAAAAATAILQPLPGFAVLKNKEHFFKL
jgi:hypothetical protein